MIRSIQLGLIKRIWIASTVALLSFGPSITAGQEPALIHVSSPSDLMSALARAHGGATVVLHPGDYGELILYDKRHPFVKFTDRVTIKSADPQHPASFKSVQLVGVENFSFVSIRFHYVSAPGALEWTRPNEIIEGSRGIVIENCVFDGGIAHGVSSVADGYGTGFGLFVANSSNIAIRNSSFVYWLRAAVFANVDGLVLYNNEVSKTRSDGFNFASVSNVLIEGNYIHDFFTAPGSDDHPDMIQFWTSGTTAPSTNIVIRANILNSGRGPWTQSIFIRNEMVDTGRAGDEMFYRNIIIEDNVIYNAHVHGITVGETRGLTIKNNTLLRNRASTSGDDRLVFVPRINLAAASTNVVVINNVVQIVGDGSRIHPSAGRGNVKNNLHVQRDRPDVSNYYGHLFVNALADGDATLADLQALPGGLVEQRGVGSRLTRFSERPDAPAGFILHQPGYSLGFLKHNFDARNLFGPQGKIDTSNASVAWDFGDSSTGKGLATTHTYTQAGRYVVKADVTLPDGRVVSLKRTIMVVPPAPGK